MAEQSLRHETVGKKVSKLIYVATPHKTAKKTFAERLRVINVYSKDDAYQKLAINTLYWGLGSRTLRDGENIGMD